MNLIQSCKGRITLMPMMRIPILSIVFMICTLFHVRGNNHKDQSILETEVTINLKGVSIKTALDQLSKVTGISIMYGGDVANSKTKFSQSFKKIKLKLVLESMLNKAGFSYKIDQNTIWIKAIPNQEPKKQPTTYTKPILDTLINIVGTVTDEDGTPLANATVKVQGTTLITTTKQLGRFMLNNVDPNTSLQISYLGYESKIVISGKDMIVALSKSNSLLDDATVSVNTGYQSIPKERATGSFAFVDNQLLNRRVSTDILNRLEGVVPGLLFNRNTFASSNGEVDISIRGTSTLYGQKATLIVVDGFPYDGDINNINPNSIATISILKDAAAASIWGVKSGNGVIVIQTKTGERNTRTSVQFNANTTTGRKPDLFYNPNFLSASSFIEVEKELFSREYYKNDLNTVYPVVSPVVAILSSSLSESEKNEQINALKNFDVRNDLEKYFYQQLVNQQYAVNLKGGSNFADYFLSFGYDHSRDNLVGIQNHRTSINSVFNFYLTNKLTLTTGLNYTQSANENNSPVVEINGKGNGIYPYAQLADADGNALSIVKGYSDLYKNSIDRNVFYDWSYKPVNELNNLDNRDELMDNRLNFGLSYKLHNGLTAEAKYQYQKQATNTDNYYNDGTYYARDLINRFIQTTGKPYPVPQGGVLEARRTNLVSQRGRLQLSFDRKINSKHEVNAIAGAEINQTITEGNNNTVFGYDQNTITYQNVNFDTYYVTNPSGGYSLIPSGIGIRKLTDRYLSYYSNASYVYNGRYILSASGRIDKSNLFGVKTNQKAIPLYSAGIAWFFSQESLLKSEWLPYGKLRATIGYTGNINKAVTAVTTISHSSSNAYSGIPNAVIANPGNPSLRWEKIRQINLGIDFGIKNQLFSGSFEYFFKKGIDLFGDSPLPESTGQKTFRGNTADITGRGVDFVLNSRNLQHQKFGWTTNMLISYVMDNVTKYKVKTTVANYLNLGGGYSGTIYPLENKPLYAIYGYEWAGLDHENGDPQGLVNGEVSTDYAAIIKAMTVDNLNYIGPARTPLFGSLRNNISWKDFSLSFNVVFKLNYVTRLSSVNYATFFQSWAVHKDFDRRWQKPGDELTTNVPSIVYPPLNNDRETFYRYSEVLVSKGDHVRLQDINISYALKGGLLNNTIKQLQLYSYINNLGILWRANKGDIDPDIYSHVNTTSFPNPRTIVFGLSANF